MVVLVLNAPLADPLFDLHMRDVEVLCNIVFIYIVLTDVLFDFAEELLLDTRRAEILFMSMEAVVCILHNIYSSQINPVVVPSSVTSGSMLPHPSAACRHGRSSLL